MATPTDDPARAPAFPAWPFNYMSLYSHMAKDFGRYAQAVTKSTDPLETTRAEGDLGLRLWNDMMQGYYQLAIAPFMAMTTAMAQPPVKAAPPPAPVEPARKAKAAKSAV
jgi:hypothetical protein